MHHMRQATPLPLSYQLCLASCPACRIAEDELEVALASAITCTILAVAGPQRSRMLSTLYKDERTARQPLYPFLQKVYLERILGR